MFLAKIQKITDKFVVVENVLENNVFFRDHAWLKKSKRFNNYKKGDIISFEARKKKYLSSEGYKIGLRHIRNIQKIFK